MTLFTTPALAATQLSEYSSLYYALAKMDERAAKAHGQPNATYSPQSVRNSVIKRLCDEYISVRGKRPDPAQLDRMATLLLRDDYVNAVQYSKKNAEYTFHTDSVLDKKTYKDVSSKAIDYEQERKMIGARRKRSPHEHAYVDRTAKIRNAERKQRYKAFVNGEIDGVLRVSIA